MAGVNPVNVMQCNYMYTVGVMESSHSVCAAFALHITVKTYY